MHLVKQFDIDLLVVAIFELFRDKVIENVDMLGCHFFEEPD